MNQAATKDFPFKSPNHYTTNSMLDLQTPVQFVKGVGPRRAHDLAGKNIHTVEDLLYTLPYRYEDRTQLIRIKDLQPGHKTSILVEILTAGLIITSKSRQKIFNLVARDESGIVHCKWFHSEYLAHRKIFRKGQKVIFHGKFEADPYAIDNLQSINPEFEIFDYPIPSNDSIQMGRIVPVYEAIKSCGPRLLRRMIYTVLGELSQILETLPPDVIARHKLMDRRRALQEAHFPSSDTSLEALGNRSTRAIQRLIFEELFLLEVGILWKRHRIRKAPGIAFRTNSTILKAVKKLLPFHPTTAQKRVLKQMADDMHQSTPMNRLLQGDVGCGKTVVALEASAIAIENGYQVAFMAPTEILAEQHYFYAKSLYGKTSYRVGLLKSGIRQSDRTQLLELLSEGKIQILIGTHALLEADVCFQKLGLVVIDEQHRFGVIQRFNLMKKGTHPHTLVMTATPIPRTLSMTLYGDLDISIIDEMPPNRTTVTTHILEELERPQVYRFIANQIKLGRQAYVLCPLLEESEKLDLRAARKTFAHLARDVFPEFQIELLHGRLKSQEKNRIMQHFTGGQTNILVSTTVVEVGVDVANATVILIEHAERFGLAQLHQLRGRVGRGQKQSYCLLMRGKKKLSDEATERLTCLQETTDGFAIAEKDLQIRGSGEFFGTRQSGLPTLRVANLFSDQQILDRARREATHFVDNPTSQQVLTDLFSQLNSTWKIRYGLVGVG